MRAVVAAVAIVLMTAILALHATPSGAQIPSISEKPKDKKSDGEAAMRAAAKKAEDRAYKSAVDNVPDQKFDPWRSMR
jgi:hypothetical protein